MRIKKQPDRLAVSPPPTRFFVIPDRYLTPKIYPEAYSSTLKKTQQDKQPNLAFRHGCFSRRYPQTRPTGSLLKMINRTIGFTSCFMNKSAIIGTSILGWGQWL
ncbi:MAG TPA: hypothetical protein DCR95_05985 [Desulfobacter sp.]|nr:hypothetical protein [Desulfobacter sp.]